VKKEKQMEKETHFKKIEDVILKACDWRMYVTY
jgi:hypothetical protein